MVDSDNSKEESTRLDPSHHAPAERASFVIDITPPETRAYKLLEINATYTPAGSKASIYARDTKKTKEIQLPFNPITLASYAPDTAVEFTRGGELVSTTTIGELAKTGFTKQLVKLVRNQRLPTLRPADPENPRPVYTVDIAQPHDTPDKVVILAPQSAGKNYATLTTISADPKASQIPFTSKLGIPRDAVVEFKSGGKLVDTVPAIDLLTRSQHLDAYYKHLATDENPARFDRFAEVMELAKRTKDREKYVGR